MTRWFPPLVSLISLFLLLCVPILWTDDAYLPQSRPWIWVCLPISSTDVLFHSLPLWMHSWGREFSLKQPLGQYLISHECPALRASFLTLAYPTCFYLSFHRLLPTAEEHLEATRTSQGAVINFSLISTSFFSLSFITIFTLKYNRGTYFFKCLLWPVL